VATAHRLYSPSPHDKSPAFPVSFGGTDLTDVLSRPRGNGPAFIGFCRLFIGIFGHYRHLTVFCRPRQVRHCPRVGDLPERRRDRPGGAVPPAAGQGHHRAAQEQVSDTRKSRHFRCASEQAGPTTLMTILGIRMMLPSGAEIGQVVRFLRQQNQVTIPTAQEPVRKGGGRHRIESKQMSTKQSSIAPEYGTADQPRLTCPLRTMQVLQAHTCRLPR
jgi:hypothetical protein